MDALSSILDSIKLKAVVYQKVSFTTAWGIELAQDQNSQFWRLLKGSCFVQIPGEPIIEMKVGDFVFVPHGSAHFISSNPKSSYVPSIQFVKALNSDKPMFQGDGEETVIIGGHFEFTQSIQHPFIKSLPKVIWIDNDDVTVNGWMQGIATFMNDEMNCGKLGGQIILGRLAEVLLILIIRSYMERTDIAEGFLLALKDTRISASLKTMHELPEKEWTLQQLATTASMSRSLYSKEFKRLVGETPLEYLTNWRIEKSKELLLNNKENISEVANKVGYQSEAAFNRLFKSKVGETPARYRKQILS